MLGTPHLINIAHFSKLRTAVARSENGAYFDCGGSVAGRAALRSPVSPSTYPVRFAGT